MKEKAFEGEHKFSPKKYLSYFLLFIISIYYYKIFRFTPIVKETMYFSFWQTVHLKDSSR